MTTATMQEQARALGDPTRHAIFRHLCHAGRAVSVAELNDEFPLNHNAIRQHLAKLIASGLVLESKLPSTGRGRPRLVYEVNPPAAERWGVAGPYERLSRLLLEVIRTGATAEEVGRRAAPGFRVASPSGDAVEDVSAAMARQGFEPEVRTTRHGADVVLHTCPFAATAVDDREIVCALHLGISEGLVEEADAAVSELIAYDPRKAGCRIRIERGARGPDAVATGRLTLRDRAPRR